MTGTSHIIRPFETLERIGKPAWSALETADFPFNDLEYLWALETSGSVAAETGWQPVTLTAGRGGKVEAACPLYVKNHSYGEYIFDWGWAQAYERNGIAYYPKVLSMVPFTPATGPKLLFAENADRAALARTLLGAARGMTEKLGASSLHFLFLSPEEIPYFEREGFLIRHSFQYHWTNRGYATFDDFLDALKARKRKQIVKERRELAEAGLSISRVSGDALTPAHAALFYEFYRSTTEKMGAIPYLTPEFYRKVFADMRDRVHLFVAERDGKPVAASLCYAKGEALFGRYWGASEEVRHLHFELCYYRPIEYAIEKRLRLFEAGAQGEHKVARGFLPALTYSAHWIRHPQFSRAIEEYVADEKASIANYFAGMKEHSPYREE